MNWLKKLFGRKPKMVKADTSKAEREAAFFAGASNQGEGLGSPRAASLTGLTRNPLRHYPSAVRSSWSPTPPPAPAPSGGLSVTDLMLIHAMTSNSSHGATGQTAGYTSDDSCRASSYSSGGGGDYAGGGASSSWESSSSSSSSSDSYSSSSSDSGSSYSSND